MPGSTAIIFPSEDGYKDLFCDEVCEYCNFFVLPISYSIDAVTFYDGLNTDNSIFFNPNFSEKDFKYTGIPESVFIAELEDAEERGLSSAIILCPSRRVSAIYENAASAVKKYHRRKSCINGQFFVDVVDTKSFSFGVGMAAVKCVQHMSLGGTPESLTEYVKELSNQAITLVYRTDSGNSHSFLNGSIYSFESDDTADIRISCNRILPLSSKGGNAGIDKFVNDCARNISESACYCIAANGSIRSEFEAKLRAATGKPPVLSAPLSATDEYCFSPYSIIVSIL